VERTYGTTFPDYSGTATQRRNQAVRLFGASSPFGKGYLQGNESQRLGINGIGTINYKARLSRPLPQNILDYSMNAAWRTTDMLRTNYVIRTSMKPTAMSPEQPSMSIIVYYQNMLKFYEYRITQTTDSRDPTPGDKRIKHEIWKWDGTLTPKLLASVVRTAPGVDAPATWDANLLTVDVFTYPTEFHVYNPSSTATSLKVKFSQTDITGWTLSNGATAVGSVVTDPTAPIQYGSYGFHSADCAIWVNTMTINNLGSAGGESVAPPFSVIGTASEWFLMPNIYKTTTPGFISESTVAQVKVLTGTTETGPWTTCANHTVTDYTFQNFSVTTNDYRNLCARVEVDDADHIVVDGIDVTSWRALSSITPSPVDGWKVTEGWINSNSTDRTHLHLDASQADPNLIQGVRSTRLMGIGSIVFDYRVTSVPAKLKIQYTPNVVPSDASNFGWVDVANYTFAATNGWITTNLFFGIAAETNLYVRFVSDVTNRTAVIDLKNITLWNNPTNSPSDWAAYNVKITATETNKWWLDSDRSGYLNNGMTSNTVPSFDMNQFEPYIMAPQLRRGLGTVSFLARAFTTNYVAGATNTSISIFVATDVWDKYKPDYGTNGWTKIHTFNNITNGFYRPFIYNYPTLPNNIKAVKLVVEGVRPLVANPPSQRVCIDEIVLTEAIYPRFDITGVKLLLPTLAETKQPLEGEDVGIEAQLTNVLLDPKSIQLWVTYVLGTNTWGVFNAPPTNQITKAMGLVNATNNIYRITGDFMFTGIPEQEKYTVVQYMVWAEYYREGSPTRYVIYQTPDTADHFVNPAWYKPVDFNRAGNVETGAPKATWNPYYIVYDVPPGSVWMNELNLNENYSLLAQKVFMNPYVEIAQPAWMNLKGWTVEILDRYYAPRLTKTLDSNTIVTSVTNNYGLFVIGPFDFEAAAAMPSYPPLSTTTVVHQAVQNIKGDSSASLYPGGYRLKRPMGMYEQSIVCDWDPETVSWSTGIMFQNGNPLFRYVGREHFNGSLSFTGAVSITSGLYSRTDNTNTWQQGVSTTNWTPGKMNIGQIFPVSPVPGGSNVLIISTLLSPDNQTHGWQNGVRLNPLMFKMRKGTGTNFTYVAERWFRFYNFISNNVQVLLPGQQTSITNYSISLMDVQTNMNLIADLRLAPSVINDLTTPDMIDWIQQFNDRSLAPTYLYPGTNTQLRLLDEYWLDLNPTETNYLIFAQKAVEPATNGLWLTLEMATVNGLGLTNRITYLRGDAMVGPWAKDVGSPLPWRPLAQYYVTPNSFDSNFLARTWINAFTNSTAWFKWTLDHNDLRLATNELINVPAP
jgi:hypothetical protein